MVDCEVDVVLRVGLEAYHTPPVLLAMIEIPILYQSFVLSLPPSLLSPLPSPLPLHLYKRIPSSDVLVGSVIPDEIKAMSVGGGAIKTILHIACIGGAPGACLPIDTFYYILLIIFYYFISVYILLCII